MGRAIVRHPKAFLLDEPLSNLDAKLRVQLRAELGNLHSRLGVTTIHVTHDQVEAMTLGSRVAVFSKGALQQYASPAELYHRPANIFVAGFIGSPAMNFLEAVILGSGATIDVAIGDLRLALPASAARTKLAAGRTIIVGIRPEHLDWRPGGAGLAARVRLLEQLEPESYVSVEPVDPSVAIRLSDEFVAPGGGDPAERLGPGERSMIARTPASRLPALGAEIAMTIDPAHVTLFDAASGAAL
jgi:multiple sugar transport system ATP-binding protein